MATVNSKMTALADEVRELCGVTEPLSIDSMTSKVSNANEEVNTQTDLIAQIITALDGKATGSGDNTTATSEDVTDETNAYTSKIASLETAVAALENELDGKAGGGTGGGNFETCTIEITNEKQGGQSSTICYVSVEQNQIITNSINLNAWISTSITCLCNSIIAISSQYSIVSPYLQVISAKGSGIMVYKIIAEKGTTFSIAIDGSQSGGGS